MIQNNLQFSKYKQIKDEKVAMAVLPWGATEAHNYHLPYGTDTILAEYVAVKAAQLANGTLADSTPGSGSITVLPSVAYGVNTGQMEVKLCMNLNPSTQMAILADMLEVLRVNGVSRLVILNAHGGNLFQPIIRELSLKYPEILVASVNWWVACNPSEFFNEPGDHAGELETACMMAIRPDLVLPLSEAGPGRENRLKARGFREKWAWTPRRWVLTTQDSGVGNPSLANAQNGARFLDASIGKIAEFFCDFASAKDEKSLYETN